MNKLLFLIFIKLISAQDTNSWLRNTNLYRCMHNVSNVTWSVPAAISAQTYADSLTSLKHSNSYKEAPPAGPAGENLAMGYPDIKSVVEAWYNEVKCCGSFPGCSNPTCVSGHFTALIWKGVTEIGCGINTRLKIYVCRYRSGDILSANTANMVGYYKSMVFPPIKLKSQCI
jgi:hypothetical protein